MPDEEGKRNKDSMSNILIVAVSVCLVCSIVVSGAAVSLKPTRVANKALDKDKNILMAAGLFKQGETSVTDIDSLFEEFEVRLVDLRNQRLLSTSEALDLGIDPNTFDQRKAAKDPSLSVALGPGEDMAGIARRSHYSVAYLLRENGDISKIVLPIHGYGLWSIMYGYIAVEGDGQTVAGITFHDQQETAGLGGEVANPVWTASWRGKKIYDEDGDVLLNVKKGAVLPESPTAMYEIDGLSGATLTSRGVGNTIAYWMGDGNYGPILKDLDNQG